MTGDSNSRRGSEELENISLCGPYDGVWVNLAEKPQKLTIEADVEEDNIDTDEVAKNVQIILADWHGYKVKKVEAECEEL